MIRPIGFEEIGERFPLNPDLAARLHEEGFCVTAGPVASADIAGVAAAYDRAMDAADLSDRGIGSTSVRVHDFVNRGSAFDRLYVDGTLLSACYEILRRPFKLSSMLGRTLLPRTPAQDLHVDYPSDAQGWTMVGFIWTVDEFRSDNGATCFVPGSHRHASPGSTDGQLVPACGPAGSLVIYNGSVRHGHGANATAAPRRSVQGAFIRRDAKSATDFASRMTSDTLARIGPLAKYLLAL